MLATVAWRLIVFEARARSEVAQSGEKRGKGETRKPRGSGHELGIRRKARSEASRKLQENSLRKRK